jgi:hypothetical protein
MRFFSVAAIAAAGLLAASCNGIVDPSKNTVETFSGTIAVGGIDVPHPFSSSKSGEISVKVTALTPVSNTFIGITWAQAASDGSCTGSVAPIQQNNLAQLNVPAISGSIISGRYCLFLYDVGAFGAAETYTVTVSHP